MGAWTVTTREFVCDNCGEGEVFTHDGEAGQAGWALLNVNGKEFALCPTHYQHLKDLLMVEGFPLPANPSMMPPDPPAPYTGGWGSIGSRTGAGVADSVFKKLTGRE